ncbi:alsin [Halyomorpha halys]|uniref:alsin n=1 Tax=Halyomorpha halys TaxID=286706 RepID=UPI0006D4E1CE|nr:alsin isoform X2 [Halyomorpha halys]
MSQVHFWRRYELLSAKYSEEVTDFDYIKLITLDNSLFLLDKSNQVWQGNIDSNYTISLSRTNILAVDIGATRLHLYYVTEIGRVFRLSPTLKSCEEVVLYEESSCCSHGYVTHSRRINVKQISAGGMGVIFLSDTGELWASGDHPQLGIFNEPEPKKVMFFEGRHVTLISSGEDFNVIISHKRDDVCSINQPENGESEVFLSICPQCTSDIVASPLSPQSCSEACPLGLSYKKSCESLSASTSTSKTNGGSENKRSNDNTSSCTEDSHHMFDATECNISNQSIDIENRDNPDKGDRMSSMLLINTEAARQFLTRQLSWVSSGGEELLAEVSGPTRILRQNVTTVASLVYEGVKTVGDKVATLSRHVSGGSDNISDSFEEFEELNRSNISLNSNLRWDWSCSDGSEDAAMERNGVSRVKGARLIRGEVWVWGNAQYGQHGIGEFVKRNKPVLVTGVSHIGVCGVWCGRNHCLVQTLDGRVFGWGSNAIGQITNSDLKIQSTPLICGRAMSVGVGNDFSVLLDRSGSINLLTNERKQNKVNLTENSLLHNLTPLRVLGSGEVMCVIYSNLPPRETTLDSDIAHEQCYLEELLSVYNGLVKPLSRKSSLDESLSNLCCRYTDLLHITAMIVSTLLQGKASHEVLTSCQEEILYVYENYLAVVCDVIATNGFSHIIRKVETPSRLTSCFSDRLPTKKNSPEAVVTCTFTQPLSHLVVYKGMVTRGGCDGVWRWENLLELQESKRKEAEMTKLFWDNAGRLSEILRTPKRRIIKDSRSSSLSLQNASRFSSHWFILLSDAFIHVSGGSHTVYNLEILWVELLNDSDNNQNTLTITLPEETMTLITSNHLDKTEWYHAFQTTIKKLLNKPAMPLARTASYTFLKHTTYKDAKYTGRWLSGKMHGSGKLEWPDGRVYTGQFHNNLCHGFGRLEVPGVSVYEGQWKDGTENGHGVTRYDNGDIYIGYYKDGLENGHGVRKTGRFTSSQASVYVGEWLLGQRHGYGVLSTIATGEKYLGCWSGNMKSGSGLIVTIDGIYYEGTFSQDVLTGHGIMVFEDGTHYEGELKQTGVFGGKGVLTFPSGDYIDGTLHGTWTEGIKVSGLLHKAIPSSSPQQSFTQPKSFGDLCVGADLKWKAIFRQCWGLLGSSGESKAMDTQRAWENVAITLGSRQSIRHSELLQTTPQFGRNSLDLQSYHQIIDYLSQAFESTHHPLGRALSELVEAYTTTYSGVVHPLLLPQAVAELHSITLRLYQLVRLLFPALPGHTTQLYLGDCSQDVASMTNLLHPIILPKLYSSLVLLYSLHNKNEDDTYWKRLLKWNRQPDTTLMAFLGIDKKFWKEDIFSIAVETLQLLKTKFSPMEKLIVIQNTFQEITKAAQTVLGETFVWTMDDLFPVCHYVVVRAHIQGLGSEVHFIEDFMEPSIKSGELGIMFTTLKACFFQILQEKVSIIS